MSQGGTEKLIRVGALILVLFSLMVTGTANAESTTSTELSTNKGELLSKEGEDKKFSYVIETSTTSNFYSPSSTAHFSNFGLSLTGSYKLDPDYTISSSVIYSQNLQNGTKTIYDLPVTILHKSIPIYENIKATPVVSFIVPVNESSLEDQTLITSLTLSNTLSSQILILKNDFNLSLTTTLKKNFHRLNRSNTNTPNTEYTFSNSIILSKTINKFTAALTSSYANSWDYFKNITPTYSFTQSMSYQLNSTTTITMGHSNGGKALNYDGTSSKISLFDADSSVFFASIAYVN